MKTIITTFFLSIATGMFIPQNNNTIPDKPEVVQVAGGAFLMGNSNGNADEQPVHKVTLSDYSIGKYEVTVSQYRSFCSATGRSMPDEPSWGWQDKHPIVNVTWYDAVAYCNWLGETYGGEWRLPTEAEWEYAARGGGQSKGYAYAGGTDIWGLAWYVDNAGGQTNSVGRKKPNSLDLYDMSGNVWEWCQDWYAKDYYANSPSSNPRGPLSGSYRVLRGGGWLYSATNCRVANRYRNAPGNRSNFYGFRVVLSQ